MAEAHLVVQKHLGADSLSTWLSAHGHPTDKVATGAGFRVLRVRSGAPDGRGVTPPSASSGIDLDPEA